MTFIPVSKGNQVDQLVTYDVIIEKPYVYLTHMLHLFNVLSPFYTTLPPKDWQRGKQRGKFAT